MTNHNGIQVCGACGARWQGDGKGHCWTADAPCVACYGHHGHRCQTPREEERRNATGLNAHLMDQVPDLR